VRAAETVAGMTPLSTKAIPLTGAGTILGTLPYMWPEQLEGAEADARTDIFALGAVIYEMITGRQAFEGKSHASLIAAILERDPPPISSLQPMTPRALDHVVRTCLTKDPDARWQTAHDVLIELKWIAEAGSQQLIAKPSIARKNRRELLLSMLVASLSVALLVLAFAYFRKERVEEHPISFQVPMPDKVSMHCWTFRWSRQTAGAWSLLA
jgi:eukaryotic-like serine/threonine-protein kinase